MLKKFMENAIKNKHRKFKEGKQRRKSSEDKVGKGH